MPLRISSETTESVGCAPTLSQCFARSASMLIVDGSVRGLYQPMFSIMRPSRGERASAIDDAIGRRALHAHAHKANLDHVSGNPFEYSAEPVNNVYVHTRQTPL